MSINRTRICMNALMAGRTLELKDQKYRLFKPGEDIETPSVFGTSDIYWLGYEMVMNPGTDERVVYLGCDIPFTKMLDMFESITDEQATIIGANTVLTGINKKERTII